MMRWVKSQLSRVIIVSQHAYCGLRYGHSLLLHREDGRLSLKCMNCGWESTGIETL